MDLIRCGGGRHIPSGRGNTTRPGMEETLVMDPICMSDPTLSAGGVIFSYHLGTK